jgi:uncharacterized protein (DUF1810 family)
MDQSHSIERFAKPQESDYTTALAEIRSGRKRSHWMWYIFPQLRGLGASSTSWYYGIEDLEEAEAYLMHPVFGSRLCEITQAALDLPEHDAYRIFGSPDHMKFHSCMTLFSQVSEEDLFKQALEKFFGGLEDEQTLELLEKQK